VLVAWYRITPPRSRTRPRASGRSTVGFAQPPL